MVKEVDKDSLLIRRDILKTICDMMFTKAALKDDFRECGGFTSMLSALTSLRACMHPAYTSASNRSLLQASKKAIEQFSSRPSIFWRVSSKRWR